MRFRLAGGLDLTTAALLVGGVVLVAVSLIAAGSLVLPTTTLPLSEPTPTSHTLAPGARPAASLPTDRVAAVVYVNSSLGAVSAIKVGDRVDILGYFSSSASQTENTTRTILEDVLVLSTQPSGSDVALTLAVQQSEALLVNETQALGVRPFVMLPATHSGTTPPPATFTDSDLAARLAEPR
ncbi:MAG: hypothetical protein NVSMB2_27930 [Chloroflexota bacterium]